MLVWCYIQGLFSYKFIVICGGIALKFNLIIIIITTTITTTTTTTTTIIIIIIESSKMC